MTKAERCVRLLLLFQRKGSLATREIQDLLDCDRQAAIRATRTLVDAGVPLEPQGEGPYRRNVLPQEFRRTGFVFTQGDAFAMHIARTALPYLADTAVDEWLGQLVDKLQLAEPTLTAERRRRFEQRFVHVSDPYRPYAAHDDVLDTILDGLLESHTLKLDYAGRTRTDTPIVEPLALVVFHRGLYLLADVQGGEARRRFAVERIQAAERHGHFEYPADFDPRAELAGPYGIFAPEHPVDEVRLRFMPALADLVRSRHFHPTQRFEDVDGGGVDLVMHTTGRELVNLALEYGYTVEVISPPWLRERVAEQLRRALAHYA